MNWRGLLTMKEGLMMLGWRSVRLCRADGAEVDS